MPVGFIIEHFYNPRVFLGYMGATLFEKSGLGFRHLTFKDSFIMTKAYLFHDVAVIGGPAAWPQL